MMANVGGFDRVGRAILGIVLAVLGGAGLAGKLAVGGGVAWAMLIVGVVLIGTAMLRFCPLYLPFGINTAKKD